MIQPTKAQWEQWEAEGYLVLEDAIVGDELKRLQDAFDRCREEVKADWLAGIATETPA